MHAMAVARHKVAAHSSTSVSPAARFSVIVLSVAGHLVPAVANHPVSRYPVDSDGVEDRHRLPGTLPAQALLKTDYALALH